LLGLEAIACSGRKLKRTREAQKRTEGRTRKKDNISRQRINDKVRLLRREK
jgi:hypothetical protein